MAEVYALPYMWNDAEHKNPMCDWLRANNIDPNTVPVRSRITVSDGHIAVEMIKLDAAGGKHLDEATRRLALETRVFPLLAPMPEKLRAALLLAADPVDAGPPWARALAAQLDEINGLLTTLVNRSGGPP